MAASVAPAPTRLHPGGRWLIPVLVGILVPTLAFLLQELFWNIIQPYVWFVAYPAVLLSAWLGGRRAGLITTVLSAAIVWHAFMPPRFSWVLERPIAFASIAIFLLVGSLISHLLEHLESRNRQSTAALRERDDLLRRVSRMARIGGWQFDPATGHGSWTPEIAEIQEVDPAITATVDLGLSLFQGESRTRIQAAVRNAIEHGTPYDLELEMTTARGRAIWVHTLGQPIVENGRTVRVQGTLQDVTDRHLAEDRIRELNRTLEERVEQRTAALLAANRELDAFAYAVSHDLRAPLRAISGFSQALLEDHAPTLPTNARQHLDEILLATRHMGDLIDGLLRLSRSTRTDLRLATLDLSTLASDLLHQLARSQPERNVATHVEPGLSAVGDPDMIQSVLANLLSNAWKFTTGTPEPVIRVHRETIDGTPAIAVSDNGAGFDPRHAARLFQPFQRLHRQEEFPGLGIGLATAHRIIQRHGGILQASATPGRGATFRFSLPGFRVNEPPHPAPPPTPTPPPAPTSAPSP